MGFHGLQNLLRVDTIIRHSDGGHYRVLPGIEEIDLGYGDVEALTQAVFETLDNVALLFERVRTLDMNVESQHSNDWHLRRSGFRHLGRDTLHSEGFDNIADLNAVEVG